MDALTPEVVEFLDANPVGVLATVASDGIPGNRLSTTPARTTGC